MQLDDLNIDERYKVYYSNGSLLDKYEGIFRGFVKSAGHYRVEMHNQKSFTQIPTREIRKIEKCD